MSIAQTVSATAANRNSHISYRPDIDGLRALAVVAVVLFHAFPEVAPGGFVGVDIFFVISGFLISSIIFKSLRNGAFSFGEFYTNRVKRIFPALALVLIFCYVAGWFTLLKDEYRLLGKHIVAGAGFLQNFVLQNEAGYFDTASELKPLMHLWSLAIEEQFYLFYPLLVWLAWRLHLNLLVFLSLLGVFSFGFSVRELQVDPVGAFFLPHFRFWELLAGAVLAYICIFCAGSRVSLLQSRIAENILSALGAAFVLFPIFVYKNTILFPGFAALLPVLGAVLLVMSKEAWINTRLLAAKPAVFLGLISYPLYLWHWPLLSFYRLTEGDAPGLLERVLLVFVSVLLAWGTYVLLEKPLRFGGALKRKSFMLVIVICIVATIGAQTYYRGGFAFRSVQKQAENFTSSLARTPRTAECFDLPYAYKANSQWNCKLGATDVSPRFFAYGDSHALSMLPVLEKFGAMSGTQILFVGASGCPPLLGVQSMRGTEWIQKHDCKLLNKRVFAYIKENRISSVLLIGRWTYYTRGVTRPDDFNPLSLTGLPVDSIEESRSAFLFGLRKTIEEYQRIGVKVYIFQDNPQQKVDPLEAYKKAGRNVDKLNKYSVSAAEHRADQAWVESHIRDIARVGGVTVIDLADVLCEKGGRCPLTRGGKSLYFDADHLSVAGSLKLYEHLTAVLGR